MATCRVCWTCRGLFLGDVAEATVTSHINACTHGKNGFIQSVDMIRYFVCDKSDFSALNTLKDTLRKHSRKIFSSLHVQKVLPHPLIKILLSLCVSDRSMKHIKLVDLNELKASNKEIFKLTTRTHGKVDKESQTFSNYNSTENAMAIASSLTETLANKDTSVNIDLIQNKSSTSSLLSSTPINNNLSYVVVVDDNMQQEFADKLATQCDILKESSLSFYVCRLCSHKSKSDQLMLRHLKSHNDGQIFECSDCKFSTMWRKDWKHHLLRHQNKTLLCLICGVKFSKKDELSLHMSSCHSLLEPQKLKCTDCDYLARNIGALKEHKRKHTGEVFTCPHQGCSFQSLYDRSLQKHLKQKHALEKKEICHVCGFQTRHASSLSKHMMLHSELKPYKCSQCSFTALYPSEIILHAKRKHLKQKRFSCPTCSFVTSYPWAIQKHIMSHEGKKGYACSVCGEGMETLQKAKKHMMNSHGCENYQILSEPSTKKVKPSDYEILYNQDINLNEAELVVRNETVLNESASKKKESLEIAKSKMKESFITGPVQKCDIKNPNTNQYTSGASSSKGGNPMLCATTTSMNDADNSLTEDSLFDLMSDFPRPPTLNRCQSASTLMFASFSPHLIDRPLTPDFFTDSPSVGSFFPNFSSKHLETDTLSMGNFEGSSHQLSIPQTAGNHSSSLRGVQPLSPLLPSLINSPSLGNPATVSSVRLTTSPVHEGGCMDMILQSSVLADISQLNRCSSSSDAKMEQVSFSNSKTFHSLVQDYSPEIEAAIAGIPLSEESQSNICLIEESPFPSNSTGKSSIYEKGLL